MSTRSAIAFVSTEDENIQAIYAHWDGYPSHNGRILKEHYTDYAKVKRLIEHGDVSVLAEEIDFEGQHSYNEPQKGVCVFYGRDRGEYDTDAREFRTVDEVTECYSDAEYVYVFQNGEWLGIDTSNGEIVPDKEYG